MDARVDKTLKITTPSELEIAMTRVFDAPRHLVFDAMTKPQHLMRWVAQHEGFLGIRYFTTKHDPSTNSQDWSINLALPSRTTKDSGYCDFLASRTRFTRALVGRSFSRI